MNRRELFEVIALSVACAAGWLAVCFLMVKELAR